MSSEANSISPGLKAAYAIYRWYDQTGYGTLTVEDVKTIAAIIDRETGVAELLGALRDLVQAHDVGMGKHAAALRIELARAAIAKASQGLLPPSSKTWNQAKRAAWYTRYYADPAIRKRKVKNDF